MEEQKIRKAVELFKGFYSQFDRRIARARKCFVWESDDMVHVELDFYGKKYSQVYRKEAL